MRKHRGKGLKRIFSAFKCKTVKSRETERLYEI